MTRPKTRIAYCTQDVHTNLFIHLKRLSHTHTNTLTYKQTSTKNRVMHSNLSAFYNAGPKLRMKLIKDRR